VKAKGVIMMDACTTACQGFSVACLSASNWTCCDHKCQGAKTKWHFYFL